MKLFENVQPGMKSENIIWKLVYRRPWRMSSGKISLVLPTVVMVYITTSKHTTFLIQWLHTQRFPKHFNDSCMSGKFRRANTHYPCMLRHAFAPVGFLSVTLRGRN